MKQHLRTFIALLVTVLLLSTSALAASSVPSPVLNSAKSVVRVIAESISEWSSGSGFIIGKKDGKTLIATNYHVVESSPHKIYVYDEDGNEVSATLLAYSSNKDFAVLQLDSSLDQSSLTLNHNGAKQGDAVYAVGFPADADALSNTMAQTSKEATITDGIVSSIHDLSSKGYGETVSILQINADINHGNSGGPLFNKNGEVVGINTYGVSAGINGSISVQDFIAFLNDNNIPYNHTNPLLFILLGILLVAVVAVFFLFKKRIPYKKALGKLKALFNKKGTSLEDYISQKGGLGVANTVSLLMPVITFIRDMHMNGNLHLEIVPKRISISSKDIASIKQPQRLEENRYNSGFAAPEIYSGSSIETGSDIYSLCAILYYAATGIIPENALSRSKKSSLDFSSISNDKDFIDVVKKGLSLDVKSRQKSVQEIIDKLIKFNASSLELSSSSTQGLIKRIPDSITALKESAEKSKKPLSRKGKIAILISSFLVLAIVYLFGPTFMVWNSINQMDFNAAYKWLNIPGITKTILPNGDSFISAGKLYNSGLYLTSLRKFIELKINKKDQFFFSTPNMIAACRYSYAAECEKNGEISQALYQYKTLKDYKDSEEKYIDLSIQQLIGWINGGYDLTALIDEGKNLIASFPDQNIQGALYQTAQDKIEENDYLSAYILLLSVENYSDASEILPDLKEYLYQKAVDDYHSGSNDSRIFELLNNYKDSDSYALLAKLKSSKKTLNNVYSYYEDYDKIELSNAANSHINGKDGFGLFDLVGFEDANDIIMAAHDTAKAFLKGKWRSTNGGYYFEMDNKGSTSYDLPWFDYGEYYVIKDGNYLLYTTGQESKSRPLFKFDIVNKNTVTVYCYKNSTSYILNRQ